MLHLSFISFTLIRIERARSLPSGAHYSIAPSHGGTCRAMSIFTFARSTVPQPFTLYVFV